MNLKTRYLGLELDHPLVPSASPLSSDLDGIRRLEDAGAPAIVLFSLFEEQINQESRILDHYLAYGTESYAEALSYFPQAEQYHVGPDGYLNLIRRAKESTKLPVIANLNGVSSGGWTQYAKLMEEAGADALELNIYYLATNPDVEGSEIEKMYTDVVSEVVSSVRIPVAVKVGPYFSSMSNMAKKFAHAGAKGLVMFNRFYQPDFDLEELEVKPNLVLSTKHEIRLPLHWTAILYGRVPLDFAITSGVHSHWEVLKALMAGANVAMTASELLARGLGRIREIVGDMATWMAEHEYESVQQMIGSMSQINVAEPAAYERANYQKVLQSFRPDSTGLLV
ncbi:MAG TPA: dihydroorotate dehydrogenase-like protein [Armatimonadetes bacterium]|jgi:dihydroorotate dehydrogenase (fumarate)|nr:dihydroorotate dehydrogenase-like protein [Armatimonadota bacterium]